MDVTRVAALYVTIGRGHPFYLDGIVQRLDPDLGVRVCDVLDGADGASRLLWFLARALYRHGSSWGGARPLYARLRSGVRYQPGSAWVRRLGAPLARLFADPPPVLLVSHPLLVAALAGRPELVYQHGELAVPPEALRPGPHRVLTPDAESAVAFIRAGHAAARVYVTGLCVEHDLVAGAPAAAAARLDRLRGPAPLTGGCFSSGAEPRAHVQALTAAATDAVRHGGAVVVVAQRGGTLQRATRRAFRAANLPLQSGAAPALPAPAGAGLLCLYGDRRELESITARVVPQLDYLVAPAHERSHWALGLGLPLFMLDPPIGSFAPLNRVRLLAEDVAEGLARDAAESFGTLLDRRRREGVLARRAREGSGRFAVDGFERAAAWVDSWARAEPGAAGSDA